MTVTLNGNPPRKQLGDQLDRLDGILDVLADALPAAVADACKEGARQAFKEAVLELLANPDVRALLAPAAPAPAPAAVKPIKPTWWQRLKARVRQLKTAAVGRATAGVQGVVLAARVLTAVLPVRRIALVAVGVGLAAAAAGLVLARLCPPAVTAAAGGVGAAAAAVTSQAAGRLRRAGRIAPAGG